MTKVLEMRAQPPSADWPRVISAACLVLAAWLAALPAAAAATPPVAAVAAVAVADASPLDSRCPTGSLVDAPLRDAALAALDRLVVRTPGRAAHGAIRTHHSAGHVDPSGQAWHRVSAYPANLGLIGALRVDKSLLPVVADWLRWQTRQIALVGPVRGVVRDQWVRQGDVEQAMCPPGLAAALCGQVDAYDSTAASLLLLARAYAQQGGDPALLRQRDMQRALEAAAQVLADMGRPDGLTWAKPDHPVAYLMDAVESDAGWRAWAGLQREVYGRAAAGEQAVLAARKVQAGVQAKLWDSEAGFWRVSADGPPLRFERWYPDTVAQAWPLLWSGGTDTLGFERARSAWRGVARHWQGEADWARRNVDPDGFWWPAVAVAAHCVGDDTSARVWVARARARWLLPTSPFAWPFQVSDLLWLLWLADPKPAPNPGISSAVVSPLSSTL